MRKQTNGMSALGRGWIVGLAIIGLFLSCERIKPQTGTVVVPDFLNSTVQEARHLGEEYGLLIEVVERKPSFSVPEGFICEQEPFAGSLVKKDTPIKVTISKGTGVEETTVPNLVNLTLGEAERLLVDAKLQKGEVNTCPSSQIPEDQIIRTSPLPGEKVVTHTMVNITISGGSYKRSYRPSRVSLARVPNLIGRKLSTAKSILNACGLRPGRISYRATYEYYKHTVFAQYPRYGRRIPRGSSVNLTVAALP